MLYVKDIISKCGGTLISGDINLVCDSFSKDTRTINKGDIYVGIKGENFDGNKFYNLALDNGAKACILDNINIDEIEEKYKDKTIIKVNNSIECLQKLAKYKRSLYNIPVIAVTGSVGKTSTKDMIYSVLSTKYKVLKTEGNNNNHIGLPLTILRLKDEEVMVLEMGMNNRGEISLLTDIAKPTLAVITNVGTAHIGNLGSRENIMKAKLEIIEGLNGPLLINNDNDILHDNIDNIKNLNNVITFGINNHSDYMATDISDDLTKFKINNNDIYCSIGNTAFIYNSLVAYIMGSLCKIDAENIKVGIENFKLTSNRLEYKKIGNNITIIDDTYNASLDSIKSSLEILKKDNGKRKIAIIGDIFELGEFSENIHRIVGAELIQSGVDIVILIGKETKYTLKYLEENNYENKYHFDNEKDSYEFISSLLQSGDTVLLKGSHAMNLKNIVLYLLDCFKWYK